MVKNLPPEMQSDSSNHVQSSSGQIPANLETIELFGKNMDTHLYNKQLLATIITHILDSDVIVTPDSLWDEAVAAGLDPLSVEIAIYSLEATTRQKITDSFYEGSVEKLFGQSIGSFVDDYLEDAISDDPLFVTRVIAKVAQSATWEEQEDQEQSE